MAAVHTIPAHVPFLEALAAELVRRPVDALGRHARPAAEPPRLPGVTRRAGARRRRADAAAAAARPVGEIDAGRAADRRLGRAGPAAGPAAAAAPPPAHPPRARQGPRDARTSRPCGSPASWIRFLDEVRDRGRYARGPGRAGQGRAGRTLAADARVPAAARPRSGPRWWPSRASSTRSSAVTACSPPGPPAGAASRRSAPSSPPASPAASRRCAELLGVVARLPQGCIVLPGLDCDGEEDDWRPRRRRPPAALPEATASSASASTAPPSSAGRTRALPAARPSARTCWPRCMRPAATSDGWQRLAQPPSQGRPGLEIVDRPRPRERGRPARPSRPRRARDAGRASRSSPPTATSPAASRSSCSAGASRPTTAPAVPLDQSPPGSFLLLTAHCIVGDGDPDSPARHAEAPLASGGTDQGEFRRKVRALERALLRGPRPAGGLGAGRRAWRSWPDDRAWRAPGRRRATCAALARASCCAEAGRCCALLAARRGASSPRCSRPTSRLPSGWPRTRRVLPPSCGPEAGDRRPPVRLGAARGRRHARRGADRRLPGAAGRHDGPADRPPASTAHPRVSILGQLESRLQQADLVLIAGLNEGVWPRYAESGPWLSRPMRGELGLPPAELQVGIAAHDLFMAACAPEVVFSRARKDEGGAPPSPRAGSPASTPSCAAPGHCRPSSRTNPGRTGRWRSISPRGGLSPASARSRARRARPARATSRSPRSRCWSATPTQSTPRRSWTCARWRGSTPTPACRSAARSSTTCWSSSSPAAVRP